MNKEEFDQLINAQQTLDEAADKLINEYRTLWVSILGERLIENHSTVLEAPYGGLYVRDIDKDEIRYHGDEYWSYGGHEHHSFELPTRYLYEDWKEEVTAELKQKLETYNSRKKSLEDSQRQKDLAKLEELKNKYER
jgi:hypothetical protein